MIEIDEEVAAVAGRLREELTVARPSIEVLRRRSRRRRLTGLALGVVALLAVGTYVGSRHDDTSRSIYAGPSRPVATNGDASSTGLARGDASPSDCVASGPATVTVPDVTGKRLDSAIRTVEKAGLNVVGYGVPGADPVSLNARIWAQKPSGGEEVPRGACIGFRTLPGTGEVQLAGQLPDGRAWAIHRFADGRLCLLVGMTDFGCDGAVTPRDAGPAYPRKAVENNGFPTPQSGVLLYGVLPAAATSVELFYTDGRATTAPIATDSSTRIWAAPITPGDNPLALEYRDQENETIKRYPLG